MVSLYTIATILFFHWLTDFFLQSDRMAKGKSSCNFALTDHVSVYTIGLIFIALLNLNQFNYWGYAVVFFILNSTLHWLTDWITSRATSLLWKEGKVHDFFVVIGADQLIHYLTLFGTFVWLSNL